jgi:hypothetical protein
MFTKIVSGGQTGVDRAALDVALELGLPCGGWCPRGRKAEDGPLVVSYPLQETPSGVYAHRTEWNVRDSDGTLILTVGEPAGGTALTCKMAVRRSKPCLVLDLGKRPRIGKVRDWATERHVRVLNVAGPRESGVPGIYKLATRFLRRLLRG